MKLYKYTLEQLKQAVASSYSYRQVLMKLSVVPAGGNYAVLKKAIEHFNLNSSHFRGRGWNKGMKFQPKRPIEKYLSNEYPINSNRLRKRLIQENIFKPTCFICKNSKWMGKPIPLELDHINGNTKDNSLSNLRVLCPNCHAQTPTYRGKNIMLKV